ncbi:methyltransferase [Asticcacaulis sp.]|uniref:methyltransferase n=1 Tax=Asticcacaulis sp. TaxID=1872648 RepID=UPI002D002C6D|nr:methyltransferase [Asticcacaulis sp.]HTM81921.1 methyltransferase [Asticcacaulis sp.]
MQNNLHYTPEKTAEYLVASSTMSEPQTVADFCAGDGSLIKAAASKWPSARLFINDIDEKALGSASQKVPTASFSSVDFLGSEMSDKLSALGFDRFNTIVLNPPFANKGARRWRPRGLFSDIDCSQAMAFLLTAANHLENNGEILAILPASTIHSDLDRDARSVLKTACQFQHLTEPEAGIFPKIAATTYIARVSKVEQTDYRDALLDHTLDTLGDRVLKAIVRGNLSTKKADRIVAKGTTGMIHTTSIRDGQIQAVYELSIADESRARKLVPGNYLLIPRVGKVRPENICSLNSAAPIILSDCLFAVRCENESTAAELRARVIQRFQNFRKIYNGTGAPYLTRIHLAEFLRQSMPKKVLKLLTEASQAG